MGECTKKLAGLDFGQLLQRSMSGAGKVAVVGFGLIFLRYLKKISPGFKEELSKHNWNPVDPRAPFRRPGQVN